MLAGFILVLPLLWLLRRGFDFDPHEIESPLVGKPAPDFVLPNLDDGEPVQRVDLQGKPLVLNFWATWCPSCPQEHPVLVAASKAYGADVQFVGIAYQDRSEAIRGWLERHGGAAFPTLVDVGGKAAIAYGVYGVPETFFIDKEGVIRDKQVGPLSPVQLKAKLEGLL
jgi:cytochrome c biogenesis protein CcmG/thiol:disulfide interchange protein DsbE